MATIYHIGKATTIRYRAGEKVKAIFVPGGVPVTAWIRGTNDQLKGDDGEQMVRLASREDDAWGRLYEASRITERTIDEERW